MPMMEVDEVYIEENKAGNNGGAMFIFMASYMNISNSEAVGN